jgi:hypothetical protein
MLTTGWYRRSIGPHAKEVVYVIAKVRTSTRGTPIYRLIHFSGFNELKEINLADSLWKPWNPSEMHLQMAFKIVLESKR